MATKSVALVALVTAKCVSVEPADETWAVDPPEAASCRRASNVSPAGSGAGPAELLAVSAIWFVPESAVCGLVMGEVSEAVKERRLGCEAERRTIMTCAGWLTKASRM